MMFLKKRCCFEEKCNVVVCEYDVFCLVYYGQKGLCNSEGNTSSFHLSLLVAEFSQTVSENLSDVRYVAPIIIHVVLF